MGNWKATLKKVWYFIWEDDSVWSWIVNIALAFLLIKFIVYPGLGYALQTTHPVVAVVSESMEHNGNFEDWWQRQGAWYIENGISRQQFEKFSLKSGFNKGDIMILYGKKRSEIEIGNVIVFWSTKREPIIHRVVKKWTEGDQIYFGTKGDHNPTQIRTPGLDEAKISSEQIIGNAIIRIPLLGYIKIWFVSILGMFGVNVA